MASMEHQQLIPWILLYQVQVEQNDLKEKYNKILTIVDKLLEALHKTELFHQVANSKTERSANISIVDSAKKE